MEETLQKTESVLRCGRGGVTPCGRCSCGTGSAVCPLCGVHVDLLSSAAEYFPAAAHVPEKRHRKRHVEIALCLFLGIFGAHKFYMGKQWQGVLYLLTGGLLLFGVIVDLVVLLFAPPDA